LLAAVLAVPAMLCGGIVFLPALLVGQPGQPAPRPAIQPGAIGPAVPGPFDDFDAEHRRIMEQIEAQQRDIEARMRANQAEFDRQQEEVRRRAGELPVEP
jgi:hypothetical protein